MSRLSGYGATRMKKTQLALFSITMLGVTLAAAADAPPWSPMPIRTDWEFSNSRYGGEGEQLFHGIARCAGNPDYIYLNEDVDASWRSEDAGYTWTKTMDRGLKCPYSFSIEVDPVNPLLVFAMTDLNNNYYEFEEDNKGLYRSTNGGDDWTRVLDAEPNIEWAFHRGYRHCIAYDPISTNETNATRWYLAVQSGEFTQDTAGPGTGGSPVWTYGGIYMSEDSGITWTKQCELPGHHRINAIHTHPSDGQTLYIASRNGLFISTNRGVTVQSLGDLPNCSHGDPAAVRSLEVHPTHPDIIYVGLADTHYYEWSEVLQDKVVYTGSYNAGIWEQATPLGVYKSINGGTHFAKLANSPSGMSLFMNPGHPDYLHLITGGNPTGWTSTNAGADWTAFTLNPDSYVAKHTTTGEDITRAFGNDQSGMAPNPADPNDIVAFGSGSILRSEDGGQSFGPSRTKFTGFASAFYSSSFMYDPFDPDWLGLCALDITMVRSETAGAFFEHVNVVPIHQWYYDDRFTAPRSATDTNIISIALIPWFGSVSGALQPVEDSGVIVAAVGKYFYNYLMRSEDRGRTWTFYDESVFCDTIEDYQSRSHLYNFIGFDTNATDTVYAGDKVSFDAGVTWTTLPVPSSGTSSINVVGLSYDSGGTWVYAEGNYLAGIWRSRDPVSTGWTEVVNYADSSWQFHGIDRKPIVVVNPADPSVLIVPGDDLESSGDISYGLGCDNSGRRDLVILRNGIPHYTGLIDQVPGSSVGTYMAAAAFDPSHPEVIYAAFSSQGLPTLFRSEDGGSTWINIDGNRPWGGECVLSVHPVTGELFVGSTFGTWILPPPYASDTPNYDRQFYPGMEFTNSTPPTVPAGLAGQGLTDSSIEIIWDQSTHPEGGVMLYEIFRNGSLVGTSYFGDFTDTGADLPNGLDELASYSYSVRALSRAGVPSEHSSSVILTTTGDSTPPKIEEVPPTTRATNVLVLFDEPVQRTSAQDASNYSIDQSVTVQSAELDADRKTVLLTTSAMSAHTYQLSVSGVRDASSRNNLMIATNVSFQNWNLYYPSSPVSYWLFDGSTSDVAGTNHGSWRDGGSSYGDGWLAQGLSLNGQTYAPRIKVLDSPSLGGMAQLSVSFWAKKDVAAVGGTVFEKGATYRIIVSQGFVSYYINLDGSIDHLQANVPNDDTQWHHYCLVYDGSLLKLYVDGVERSSHAQTGTVADSSNWLCIGGSPYPTTEAFAGAVDEVRLFNTALTTNQVTALSFDQDFTIIPPSVPKATLLILQ